LNALFVKYYMEGRIWCLGARHPEIGGPSIQLPFPNNPPDDEAYWVVYDGPSLGIYKGRYTALRARSINAIFKCPSEDEACELFVYLYMQHATL
jgi:hypothetical protein